MQVFHRLTAQKRIVNSIGAGDIDKRRVVSLGLTDRSTGQNWIFEATPEFIANDHMACTTDRIRLI